MVAISLEKQSLLTQESVRELFDYHPDIGILTHKTTRHNRVRVGDVLGYIHQGHGHVVCEINGRAYQLHRVIWLWEYGEWPDRQVDHENEIKTDNRICNLRQATNGENQRNVGKLQRNNTSGVKGVQWNKRQKKWLAIITVDAKVLVVARCDDLHKAAAARRAAELKYFGEFAPMSPAL